VGRQDSPQKELEITMTRFTTMCASFLIAASFGSPAISQMQHGAMSHGNMSSSSPMKMSSADMDAMMKCKQMPSRAATKSRSCMAMMKAHPEMMKMPVSHMKTMKSCMKMSHQAMMRNRGCASMMKMHPDMMGMGH
jgi:hypothetical protein